MVIESVRQCLSRLPDSRCRQVRRHQLSRPALAKRPAPRQLRLDPPSQNQHLPRQNPIPIASALHADAASQGPALSFRPQWRNLVIDQKHVWSAARCFDRPPPCETVLAEVLFIPAVAEVVPIWIVLRNQGHLFLAPPSFDLLLPSDGRIHVSKDFKVDQTVDVISLGETLDIALLVLPHPTSEVAGNTRLERTRTAGHDMDIIGLASRHTPIISFRHRRNEISPLRLAPVEMTRR